MMLANSFAKQKATIAEILKRNNNNNNNKNKTKKANLID